MKKVKRATAVTSIVLTLAGMTASGAALPKTGALTHKSLVREQDERQLVRVAPGDWGTASPAEIEMLLNSVTNEMLKRFPGRRPSPMVVSPSRNGPLVMYQKGPGNEYQILLAARDDHWAEYVYEFSHELLHVLAGYDLRAQAHKARNLWFEEMLCEAAALHMLKRYALSWDVLAPRPEWRAYSTELRRFTNRAMTEKHRRLPANVTFEEWFRKNGPDLVLKPYMREKNELVAVMFLPLLDAARDWRSVQYLNLGNREGDPTFYDYLVRWHRQTPPQQRELVQSTFALFHFEPPSDKLAPVAGDRYSTLRDGS